MMFEIEDLCVGPLTAPLPFSEEQIDFDTLINDHYALHANLETTTWQAQLDVGEKGGCQDISLESLCTSELFNPKVEASQELDEGLLSDKCLQLNDCLQLDESLHLDECLQLGDLPLSPSDSFIQDGPQTTLEGTQSLIDEMEVFLRQHEAKENNERDMDIDVSKNLKEEMEAKESLEGVTNISSMVTDSGEHVIIIVTDASSNATPPLSPASSLSSSPSSTILGEESSSENESTVGAESSCSELLQPPRQRRRGPHRSSPYHHIKDRKERKKLQNVQAARRYREKKREEQCDVLGEEQRLVERNTELKSKLSEMQREAETLKRLMHELGITKMPIGN